MSHPREVFFFFVIGKAVAERLHLVRTVHVNKAVFLALLRSFGHVVTRSSWSPDYVRVQRPSIAYAAMERGGGAGIVGVGGGDGRFAPYLEG